MGLLSDIKTGTEKNCHRRRSSRISIRWHYPSTGSADNRLYLCEGQLRTFLRQDPDVIMVGEIRDKEPLISRWAVIVNRPFGCYRPCILMMRVRYSPVNGHWGRAPSWSPLQFRCASATFNQKNFAPNCSAETEAPTFLEHGITAR